MPAVSGRRSLPYWTGLLVILAFFFHFAGAGLRAGFFPDCMMNIDGAWQRSVPRLLLDLAWPGPDAYRPAGALLYRALYESFALNPLPYRLLCFALLLANLFLTGLVTTQLTRARWAGLWAMALFAYHPYFSDLYYSSSTLYDLLCALFTLAFVSLYLRHRATPRLWHTPALVLLLLAAIASKELGLLVPICLLVLEIAFYRDWPRLTLRTALPLAACFAATVLAAMPRFLVTTRFSNNPAYQLDFTGARLLANLEHYSGLLFYAGRPLTPRELTGLAAGAVLLVALARSRTTLACLACFFLLLLPVLAIEPRSLYAIYLPCAFLGAFFAVALYRVTCLRCFPEWFMGPLLLAALLFGLAPLHAWRKPFGDAWMHTEEHEVPAITGEFHRLQPTLPRRARLYLSDDPLPADDYLLTFTLRLLYHDPDLEVIRQRQLQTCPTAEDWRGYTARFDFKDWKLRPVDVPPAPCQAAP